MKMSDEIGSRRIASASGFSASVSSVNQKKLAPAPMAMPMAARITVTGSFSPLGQRFAQPDEDEKGGQNAKDDHDVHGPA